MENCCKGYAQIRPNTPRCAEGSLEVWRMSVPACEPLGAGHQLDASLLAGANWMSILCLWLTYVSGQTQDLMVARDVLHRRQSNDDHERP